MRQTENPKPAVYRSELVVSQSAIDQNGHVNNVVFVQWMQDAATQHFQASAGTELLHAIGATWVVRSHQIEYLSPAFAGDRIHVATWVASFSRVRSLRRYEFRRATDDVLLARGETDWVFVGIQDGRPRSIPESIREVFASGPGIPGA